MRLFEWCHEDAQSDVDMHKVMEKLMAFNDGINPLTMEVYDCLIADVKNPNECSEEDMDNAYDIGSCCAEMGCDLEDVNYRWCVFILTNCFIPIPKFFQFSIRSSITIIFDISNY